MSCKLGALTIAATVLVVSGCAPVDPGLGEAFHYDMAVQTIDPDPVYPDEGAKPGDNGDKAARATKRYRSDQVKQVQTMSVSSSGSGSGSGPN